MDERRNQGEGERKAAWGDEQDRLSGQVARLLNCQDCARGCIGQPDSGTRVRPGAGLGLQKCSPERALVTSGKRCLLRWREETPLSELTSVEGATLGGIDTCRCR